MEVVGVSIRNFRIVGCKRLLGLEGLEGSSLIAGGVSIWT